MDIFSRIRYGNHTDHFVKLEHDLHQIRLSKRTSKINTEAPDSFAIFLSSSRIKSPGILDHKKHIIAEANGKLMTAMQNIASSPSTQKKRIRIQSKNATGNKQECARINSENKKMADRLTNIKPLTPYLTISNLEEHSVNSRAYSKNSSKISKRLISPSRARPNTGQTLSTKSSFYNDTLISIRPNTSSMKFSSRPNTADTQITSTTIESSNSFDSSEGYNDIQYFDNDKIINSIENNSTVMLDFRRSVISEKRRMNSSNSVSGNPLPSINPSCKIKTEPFQLFHTVKKK